MSRRSLWRAFIRVTLLGLVPLLGLVLYLSYNPRAVLALVKFYSIPGFVEMPDFGPVPPPPQIDAPRGSPPAAAAAFEGVYNQGQTSFACGFVLELEDGRQVGISTAHSIGKLPPGQPAEFRTPDRATAAWLTGQIDRGRTFVRDNFTTDYVLWGVERINDPRSLLKADPRPAPQPGEAVWVLNRFELADGSSKRWPGVVLRVDPQAVWIRLEDSFYPGGYSGCPVVSQHTGRLIGMAVAGEDRHPTFMGLHPASSLVEKALEALK